MKVTESYASVIRGVSQQVAHDRLEGQHWAQDNLISDPVRGMSRRHGSVRKKANPLLELAGPVELADVASRLEQTLFVTGKEYAVFYREGRTTSAIGPLVVVDKERADFVPVEYINAAALTAAADGVSAVTSAGKYVLLSSSDKPVRYTKTDNMAASKHQHVVWVRGGANSRTFTIHATVRGIDRSYQYTTIAPYYGGVLDTSDIPVESPPGTPNPNYAKLVNDRVNAYNTAVNQHLSLVAADIAPSNIAAKLAEAMLADPAFFSNVRSDGPYVIIEQADCVITADDGGNGDMMRAVSADVSSPELVTPRHFVGKVIKVLPKQANSLAYYLKAESVGGSGGFQEVVWRECPGVAVKMDWVFLIGAFHDGFLKVADSPAALSAAIGEDVPEFAEAACGDQDSSPIPEFFSRIITHMRMFQDRLMLVAGSTVFLSKSGDYFNFFKASVLAVADDDPIEVFALGTEDDVITTGVQHDKNVILCGQRYQYLVPGRETMTPRNPFIGVQATYEGANIVAHAVAGSLLFFCQRREKRLTMQQMSPGSVADKLDAFDVSAQLDGYLTGTPRQLVAMTAPGAVFIRTEELTNGFYVYSYLDTQDQTQRLFDSWSRWTFDPNLGALLGITADDSGLFAVSLRTVDGVSYIVLDRFVRETGPSDMPYLDSMQPYTGATAVPAESFAAYAQPSVRFLVGDDFSRAGELVAAWPSETPSLMVGSNYDSLVDLTSPYIRDRDDKVQLTARVTVSKVVAAVANSAALIGELLVGGKWRSAKSWSARASGSWTLNTQAVDDEAKISIPVMKENTAYRLRLRSKGWLPLTISILEWAGQAFNTRR